MNVIFSGVKNKVIQVEFIKNISQNVLRTLKNLYPSKLNLTYSKITYFVMQTANFNGEFPRMLSFLMEVKSI